MLPLHHHSSLIRVVRFSSLRLSVPTGSTFLLLFLVCLCLLPSITKSFLHTSISIHRHINNIPIGVGRLGRLLHPTKTLVNSIIPEMMIVNKNHKKYDTRMLLTCTRTLLPKISMSMSSSESELELELESLLNNNKNKKNNNKSPFPDSLKGCICVVTGASRGIGKGVALELGAAGATVYVTGTSTSATSAGTDTSGTYTSNEDVGGPGTIEQTANEINQIGGIGIPIYCDHGNDEQVKELFDTIDKKHGRLDILVNNAFRMPPGGTSNLLGNFWDLPISTWDSIHTIGLRSHYVASKFAVPLMRRNKKNQQQPSSLSQQQHGQLKYPMIAMISSFGGTCYSFNLAYSIGKGGVDRLAKDMALEFKRENIDINVMSFYPGLVYTERTKISIQNGTWEKDVGLPINNAETPRFTGRAIVAVGTDTNYNIQQKSGSFQVVAELAKEYGFVDENGNQPPSIRSLKFLLPTYGFDEETRKKVPDWFIPDWKLPWSIMANGAPPP